MKIEPRTFTLPSGEVLTVRSLCADDAEASETHSAMQSTAKHILWPDTRRKGRVWKRCGTGSQATGKAL